MDSVTQLRLHAATREGLGWVDSLVERARSGDLVAFEQLAERYLPEAHRLAVVSEYVVDKREPHGTV